MPSKRFTAFVRDVKRHNPSTGLVLGSGMGEVAAGREQVAAVPFVEIPGLTEATVHGHRGQLLLCRWPREFVLVFAGRMHFYEGHSWDTVVRPIQLAAEFGVSSLLLTNAAGGISRKLRPGDFLAIRNQIEWNHPYCWRAGRALPSPYCPRLLQKVCAAGEQIGMPVRTGVYASVTGPSYETPAEIGALRTWGADAVGMSTAREASFAYDNNIACAAISCITNMGAGITQRKLSHQEVLDTAKRQTLRLQNLLTRFFILNESEE